MTTTIPGTIGGAISVGDSAELAALPLDGLPIGTTVWNEDVGAPFKLTTAERTVIAAETTDNYDSPTWTFANATFTGFEGCTLVVVPREPNVSFAHAYVIDSVGSATEVDVLSPPAGATTGEFFGSVVLYDDALVADSVVSANGTIGVRWVKVASSGGTVESVTGVGVDNTDPANPVMSASLLGLDWRNDIRAAVLALDSTLVRMPVSSDCTNVDTDMALGSATGTGAVNPLASIVGGGVELTSGGTAGGIRVAGLGRNAGTAKFVTDTLAGHWAIYCRAKVVTAPAASTARLVICSILDGTNDIGIGVNFAGSGTNFSFLSGAAGGTAADLGEAFGSTWHDLLLWNDGTHMHAFVDDLETEVASFLSATFLAAAAGYARSFAYNSDQNAIVKHYMNRWAMFTPEAT